MAASDAADYWLLPIRISRIVTMMRGLPPAAGMLWRSRSLQRGRKNRSDKREQQQEFGGQTLHYPGESEPQVEFEHKAERRAGQGLAAMQTGILLSEQELKPHSLAKRNKGGVPGTLML